MRVHLSPEHAAANALVAQLDGARPACTTWQDAAGNQCGRLEGREPGLPALLLGSHIDTVPDAGRYDGMLGVLLAIAVVDAAAPRARAARSPSRSSRSATRRALASAPPCSAAARSPAPGTTSGGTSPTSDGITLFEAFQDFGLDPGSPARRVPPPRGPRRLPRGAHRAGAVSSRTPTAQLAVVTSIAGARRFELTMIGKAGHAGGTPYDRRRDALVGASELVVEIERLSKQQQRDRHGRQARGVPRRGERHPGSRRVQPRPARRVRRRPRRRAAPHLRCRERDRARAASSSSTTTRSTAPTPWCATSTCARRSRRASERPGDDDADARSGAARATTAWPSSRSRRSRCCSCAARAA